MEAMMDKDRDQPVADSRDDDFVERVAAGMAPARDEMVIVDIFEEFFQFTGVIL